MTTQTKEQTVNKMIGHLENVGVENITAYLREQGVIVSEHIGRMRIKFTLSNEALGINVKEKTDEVKNFMSAHFDLGKLTFIPKSRENQLQKIEQRVRYERKQLAVGYDDKYMPIPAFEKFQQKLEVQAAEYMLIRDEIIAQWDVIVDNFKKDLKDTLESLDAINKDAIFQKIVSSIPSKKAYQDSFYMYATVKAFPVPENLEMFSPSMQKLMTEGIEEDTINTLNGILASALNEATHSLNLVLKGYKNNHTISTHAINSVKTSVKKVREKNILGHPKVDEIITQLEGIAKETDMFDAFTGAEGLTYFIYGFAKDLGIVNLLDYSSFVLSRDEMEKSYNFYYVTE